jgi:hypothetical protein
MRILLIVMLGLILSSCISATPEECYKSGCIQIIPQGR